MDAALPLVLALVCTLVTAGGAGGEMAGYDEDARASAVTARVSLRQAGQQEEPGVIQSVEAAFDNCGFRHVAGPLRLVLLNSSLPLPSSSSSSSSSPSSSSLPSSSFSSSSSSSSSYSRSLGSSSGSFSSSASSASSRSSPSTSNSPFLSDLAVCNDNSPAGFYIRRSVNSKRWVVFLEGGWYCFDNRSCGLRWSRSRPLMTSRDWPQERSVGGILSSDPTKNPQWWRTNHVLVPYCSSDSWSGSRLGSGRPGDFSFMGSHIVTAVVKHLLGFGLEHGHKVILAGSSAGAVGAMLNVDRVGDLLTTLGVEAEVRAVADSGWFLDNTPFAPLPCHDAPTCAPVQAIRRGVALWKGQIPADCRAQYPSSPWNCYFGYKLYPFLRSPLFVFQFVFDEAQLQADNVGAPLTKEQWDFIHTIGQQLRNSLRNVTSAFAPSCIAHSVLTKRDWANVKVEDVTLPQALHCWERTPLHSLLQQSQSKSHGLHLDAEEDTQTKLRHRRRHGRGRGNRGRSRRKNKNRGGPSTSSGRDERHLPQDEPMVSSGQGGFGQVDGLSALLITETWQQRDATRARGHHTSQQRTTSGQHSGSGVRREMLADSPQAPNRNEGRGLSVDGATVEAPGTSSDIIDNTRDFGTSVSQGVSDAGGAEIDRHRGGDGSGDGGGGDSVRLVSALFVNAALSGSQRPNATEGDVATPPASVEYRIDKDKNNKNNSRRRRRRKMKNKRKRKRKKQKKRGKAKRDRGKKRKKTRSRGNAFGRRGDRRRQRRLQRERNRFRRSTVLPVLGSTQVSGLLRALHFKEQNTATPPKPLQDNAVLAHSNSVVFYTKDSDGLWERPDAYGGRRLIASSGPSPGIAEVLARNKGKASLLSRDEARSRIGDVEGGLEDTPRNMEANHITKRTSTPDHIHGKRQSRGASRKRKELSRSDGGRGSKGSENSRVSGRQSRETSGEEVADREDSSGLPQWPSCNLHRTDSCAWPHCNPTCPKLLNPFTGEELNFLELFQSFGLDMASVAKALGIDLHTLNAMDNDQLRLILTQ
ncbi:palmitoleoyl-protein carboxylesterase notum isoform X2 [Oratosquilla oratoria]|uniref:palmitoleoyl-protein carboxylesterase notum isoform X2 n=1 Tax=Oratosquilla oratoria TaxID=337810 RepID=UPI003F762131